MFLKNLHLVQFKNHDSLKQEFSSELNLITGPNGTGKTNILDGIHFLCNTKSAFLNSDNYSIQHGKEFFRIEGQFALPNKDVRIECICQLQERKLFLIDGKAPEKLADYIGRFPVVLVNPYDTDLIREGSDSRRKFFDLILSQSDNTYLIRLMTYNRLLKQRNALLKQFFETGKVNKSLLAVYDEQILPIIKFISDSRTKFVLEFLSMVKESYHHLAEFREEIALNYETECNLNDFNEKFLNNISIDIAAQRTTLGIHTDDYALQLNNHSLKKYGSQGQQKTFVLALKLAHFEYINKTKKIKPLLLLDDIFDRLDEKRVYNLAELIDQNTFGQVFITDATPKRMTERFGNSKQEIAIFKTE